jgi:hypothetical protein
MPACISAMALGGYISGFYLSLLRVSSGINYATTLAAYRMIQNFKVVTLRAPWKISSRIRHGVRRLHGVHTIFINVVLSTKLFIVDEIPLLGCSCMSSNWTRVSSCFFQRDLPEASAVAASFPRPLDKPESLLCDWYDILSRGFSCRVCFWSRGGLIADLPKSATYHWVITDGSRSGLIADLPKSYLAISGVGGIMAGEILPLLDSVSLTADLLVLDEQSEC